MTKKPDYTDAHFEVVSGPLRVGDEHPTRKDWFFTGQYNAEGDPYFIRGPGWWRRRKWIRRWPYFMLYGFLGLMIFTAVASLYAAGPDEGQTHDEAISEAKARGLIADRPQ